MADNVETETVSGIEPGIKETTLDQLHQDLQEDLSTAPPGDSCKKVEETEICNVVSMGNTLNQDFVKSEELNQQVGSVIEDDCKENLSTSQSAIVVTGDGESNVVETDKTRMLTDLERGSDICDIVSMGNSLNQDFVKSEELNQQVGSVIEDDCKNNLPTSQSVITGDGESNVVKTDKTRMLTDLERGSIFVHKDTGVTSSLKIEVIDDTALIEYLPEGEEDSGSTKKKGKQQSRRKAKVAKRMAAERFKNVTTPIVLDEHSGFKKSRRIYSRQEMEALRFTDIVQQRNLWRAIYTGLGVVVSSEYDRLANSKQKNNLVDFDPRRHFQSKMEAPGILSEVAARGRRNHFNIFVH